MFVFENIVFIINVLYVMVIDFDDGFNGLVIFFVLFGNINDVFKIDNLIGFLFVN